MRRILAVLAILLGLAPASAQQVNLGNLAPSTVVGRLGSSVSGPAQAIPFATLLAQLNGVTTIITGPGSSTVGHVATWNDTTGLALADGGAISIASGKTVTDTSAEAGDVLLGASGGGFRAYAGATCSTGAVTAIAAAGTVTCSAVKAATNSTVSAPAAASSTSAFLTQGLAGALTPAVTGNVLLTISGTINTTATAAGTGVKYQIYWGTGTAPGSNHAVTSNCGATTCTAVGTVQEYLNPTTVTAADVQVPFSISVVVTGLTVGTAIWIDLAAEAVTTASDTSFVNVNIAANEI